MNIVAYLGTQAWSNELQGRIDFQTFELPANAARLSKVHKWKKNYI